MKEKSKQLQTSGETRKTNRTWHFLSNLNSLLLSKLLLLLIIPVMGSTAAWGVTETYSSLATSISGTYSTVSSSNSSVSGTTRLILSSSNGSLTISAKSGYNVTGVVLKWRVDTGKFPASTDELTISSGSQTLTGESKTWQTTWSGSASSVTFSNVSSHDMHLERDGGPIVVTLESSGGGTYTVTYNANLTGTTGSVPTDATAYAEGASVTVADNGTLAKDGYTFLGWSTASGYQSSYYTAGNTFSMGTANVTLYAQWKINGSISSSPAAGSTVKAGDPVYTTATTSASGVTQMRIAQGGGPSNAETLKSSGNLVGITSAGWSVSNGATLGTNSWVLSALLTDGTFYSDVLTNTFSVGVATPVISCSSNTVTITCATDGATIYYTTDSSTPSASKGAEYFTSFPIGGDCTVKAIAIKNKTNSEVVSQACTYGTAVTALPVTFDFSASPFTPGNITGAKDDEYPMTQNNHEIYFHGTSETEFSIQSGDPNTLQMNNNGASNHFIAIPISGINGRIDIDVWAPYAEGSGFKVRVVLDTENGTEVQTDAPSAIKSAALGVNKYEDSHFNFRMTDITATEGVLYIGPASSSYKNIEKIRITTPTAYLVPDVASVTIGDDQTKTVTIKNYSTYQALLKDVPSYVSASFNPSTGELVITPTAVGTDGSITFSVDTDGDGVASSVDLSIPVTVNGITIGTQPVSAVYATGATPDALTVSATHSGSAEMAYQWYKNTVNSTEGGEAISGAIYATLAAANISTAGTENASFYYCVVSAENSKSKTSDVAYVLTSSSKRYFQMSNVAGNKSTSETEAIDITGQVIAGGIATYTKNTGDGKYVLRVNTQPHYFHTNGNAVFKIELPSGTSVKSDDVISVTVNAINGTTRGVTISANSDFSSSTDFTTSSNVGTVVAKTASAANLTGATTLYIKGYNGADSYFTDLILSESAPLVVSAPTPASQSIQTGDTPATISVTASGGDGDYSYQWYSNTSASTSDATPITGATSASYIPPTAGSAGTTYYYCLVEGEETPTGYASVTVMALSHGYLTLTSSDFTDNKYLYVLNQTNYDTQHTGETATATDNFWTIATSITFANDNGEKQTCSTISETSDNYVRLQTKSNQGTMTIYVKGATSFDIVAGNGSNTSRTVDINVDGTKVGMLTQNLQWSGIYELNSSGSYITVNNPSGNNIYLGGIRFYQKAPATVTVLENGETVSDVTIYKGDGATEYEVETNGDGTLSLVKPTGAADVTNGYRTTYAEVTLNNGILSVTPLAATPTKPSTPEEITINHTDGTSYADASTTLNVTVKKHTINLAFSYDKVSFKGTSLTKDVAIPAGSLPTLTATYDDGTNYAGTIKYQSDEVNIGYFDSNTTYTIKYGGGQGGARIYAYVEATDNYAQQVAYFDLVVENGTSNTLPKTTKDIEVQQQFDLHDSEGQTVVTLTYGGYKYLKTKTGKWSDATSRGKYFIDGYEYHTRYNSDDAKNEYEYPLKGMSDDVNNMWYKTTETKPDGSNYSEFERIRPFALPCRGSYIKFEPKKTGTLTAYIWQNGQYEGGFSSKPRLGYWFDQDGWVKHPKYAPVTKQPLADGSGSDTKSLESNMTSNWTAANGDQNMAKLLKYKYCLVASPDSTTAESQFSNSKTGTFASAYNNPYYWMNEEEVDENLAKPVPDVMVPVPFHGGYMVPEACYVKYVLDVVAGKTYYFYGMTTKIGYVGMNFVEENSVADVEEVESLHLTDTDNMATFVSTRTHDYTVYDEVTLPSRFRAGEWATICLPFALSENQVEEAFGVGTQLTLYNGLIKKGTDYTIKYLSHVDTNILPGQPYFIKPSGVDANGDPLAKVGDFIGTVVDGSDDDGARITFNTVVIDKNQFNMATCSYGSNQNVDASGADLGEAGYVFTGSTNNDELLPYSYVMNAGLLRRYTTTLAAGSRKKIPTYMAYLKPNTSAALSGSMSFTADFSEENVEKTWETSIDDNPTGISIVDADAQNGGRMLNNGKVYNMMGQEIDPSAAKGIIIINGKKVMY